MFLCERFVFVTHLWNPWKSVQVVQNQLTYLHLCGKLYKSWGNEVQKWTCTPPTIARVIWRKAILLPNLNPELAQVTKLTFSDPCTVDSLAVAPASSRTVTSIAATLMRRPASSAKTTTTIAEGQVLSDRCITSNAYHINLVHRCSITKSCGT